MNPWTLPEQPAAEIVGQFGLNEPHEPASAEGE